MMTRSPKGCTSGLEAGGELKGNDRAVPDQRIRDFLLLIHPGGFQGDFIPRAF